MKRTALARGTTQLQRTRMKRKRRRARPEKDDKRYLVFVRSQPCSVTGCRAREVDPHHRPGQGLALRSHDHEAIAMCRTHHDNVDLFEGPFAGWTREQRQAWHSEQVARHRAIYARASDAEKANAEAVF